jgi:hypothetical protein
MPLSCQLDVLLSVPVPEQHLSRLPYPLNSSFTGATVERRLEAPLAGWATASVNLQHPFCVPCGCPAVVPRQSQDC